MCGELLIFGTNQQFATHTPLQCVTSKRRATLLTEFGCRLVIRSAFWTATGQRTAQAAQNFLPVVLSVPHLLQRIALPGKPSDSPFLYHPEPGRGSEHAAACAGARAVKPVGRATRPPRTPRFPV